MTKRIAVIGSGISGLSAAAYSAKAGFEVHVYEKNDQPGGRARQFKTEDGYVFDMGPSWYWMPDIINKFFQDFGTDQSHFFELVSLNPQFEMIFSDENLQVPQDYESLRSLFEAIEPGAGKRLDKFMDSAKYKYEVGMNEFVNKPCYSWFEFVSPSLGFKSLKFDILTNFRTYVKRYFKHPKLIALMEFPVIFLGASPKEIPALYSLMNYGGYTIGTWYPMGGFYQLVLAMKNIGEQQGVKFHFNSAVTEIKALPNNQTQLSINGEELIFDSVISAADYAHTETLLKEDKRNYDDKYWETRTFAPSCLIYYLGFKEKLPNLKHHTLFFENDLDDHVAEIYNNPKWPDKPLFYACCPSKTDPNVAPEGHENVFLLMPISINLPDKEETREYYFKNMISRIEKHLNITNLEDKIDYKRSYCVTDFKKDYNAYGGNAYGLANTLKQTAVLKPTIKNKKIKNLYYTGQLTIPGPGVPPSIISGRIVANEVINKI